MKKKAQELEFICQIKRDGSGLIPVSESYIESMETNRLMNEFELRPLSITNKTYIAFNFNVFIVKLKK